MIDLSALGEKFEHASQSYAAGDNITRNEEWFLLKLQEELGELTQVWMKLTGRGRRKGRSEAELQQSLEDECADLLGHVLLFAHRHKLDLRSAIERKWRFDPGA